MLRSALIFRVWAMCALTCLSAGTLSAQELDWAQKMFSELKIDFGNVARGADVRHQLIVENIYKEDIKLTDVRTTCGCSAAKPDKTLLKTHEKAVIEVVMNTTKFMRLKESNVDVTVTFDNQNYKTVRVPIRAYIRPDVVLTPGIASFEGSYYGESPTRTINIAYAGRDTWTVNEVKTKSEFITTELKQMTRGGGRVEYQLVVALKPGAPIGSFRDQIMLVTDDTSNAEVPVLVEGKIKPDFEVLPETIPLGTLQPGSEKTISVIVKGMRDFAIQTIECNSDRECFTVKISKDVKKVHVLPMTVKAPMEPGELNEVFTLTIDGREQPVTFKAVGMVAAGT